MKLKIQPTTIRATGVTGSKLEIKGEVEIPITLGPNTIRNRMIVTKGSNGEDVLLGTDFMTKNGPYLIDLKLKQIRVKSLRTKLLHTLSIKTGHSE